MANSILYRLKPAKKLKLDFFVFDTETRGLRGKSDAFIFGVVYGYNYKNVIYTVDDFKKEFLKPMYKDKKVFAHNAEYDLGVIYDNIYAFDPKAIFNGKFICATNGNCLFADSGNIFPKTSVEKLGKMLNLPKLDLNVKYKTGSKKIKVTAKDIIYCTRDCEIIFEALFHAFDFSGQICITQASLSLAYFRRYHLPFNISHNPEKTRMFYNSYYGGRNECLKMGETFARGEDVNSMYPFVMKEGTFPNPRNLHHITVKKSNQNELNIFNKVLFNYEGCCFVRLNHKKSWIGYLPYKLDGKLTFPIGIFKGWFNFNELRYGIQVGIIEILEINEFVYSDPMESIFKSFVDTLYSLRYNTTHDFEIYRLKIYLNSLYGKLSARIKEQFTYLHDVFDCLDIIDESKRKNLFLELQSFSMDRNDAFLREKTDNPRPLSYSIPSFSSYITSYARIILLKHVIKNKDNIPVYMDTDSIFCEKSMITKPKLTLSNTPVLGGWSTDPKIITNVRGLKDYNYIEKNKAERALKGVPKNAKETRPNYFEYFSLLKTKEALRRGVESGVEVPRHKQISDVYSKRIVLPNGETLPIILDN